MRTGSFKIDKIDSGLPKESSSRLNEGYGESIINYVVKENGLEEFEEYTGYGDLWLFQNDLTFDFPFPQLVKGRNNLFFIYKDKFYLIDKTSLDTPSSALSLISTGSLPVSNQQWQLVDFHNTWLFTNGLCSVYSSNGTIGVDNFVRINAATEFQGRAIFGGFDSNYFYSADWRQLWRDLGIAEEMNLGENYIYWTSIGAEDLLWLFDYSKARDGNVSTAGYSVSDSKIMELYKRGDIGFKALDWTGKVFKFIPFQEQLIAYGQGGISILSPVVSPFPSFKEKKLEYVGIPSAFAIDGNEKEQCFVDSNSCVWRLNSEGLKRLGYESYIENLTIENVGVTYDDYNKIFYISDGARSFALTNWGMTEVSQVISSIINFDSYTIACYRNK